MDPPLYPVSVQRPIFACSGMHGVCVPQILTAFVPSYGGEPRCGEHKGHLKDLHQSLPFCSKQLSPLLSGTFQAQTYELETEL